MGEEQTPPRPRKRTSAAASSEPAPAPAKKVQPEPAKPAAKKRPPAPAKTPGKKALPALANAPGKKAQPEPAKTPAKKAEPATTPGTKAPVKSVKKSGSPAKAEPPADPGRTATGGPAKAGKAMPPAQRTSPWATPPTPPASSAGPAKKAVTKGTSRVTLGDTSIKFEPPPSVAPPIQRPPEPPPRSAGASPTPFQPMPTQPTSMPRAEPTRAAPITPNAATPSVDATKAPPSARLREALPSDERAKRAAAPAARDQQREADTSGQDRPPLDDVLATTRSTPAKRVAAAKRTPTAVPEPTVEPATTAATGKKTPTVLTFNIEPMTPPAATKIAAEPVPQPHSQPEPQPASPTESLVRGLRRYPGYAPEILALAAVEHLGGEAGRYAGWVRDTYPTATADGLARLATQRFLKLARNEGAAAGVAGPFTVLLEASGLAWLQARLVLHLAAAYGHDPSDRARAGELLMLLRVHPTVATARSALDAVGDTAAPGILTSRLATPAGRTLGAAALRAGLARVATRLVPGGGAVVGAVTAVRTTERLAVRATHFYRSMPH